MKITKFVHACLLVETPERVALFDPGVFSWQSGLCKVETIERLDDIVITHEHADHYDMNFLTALHQKFPKVTIIATPPVVETLTAAGFNNVSNEGNEFVDVFSRKAHADLTPLGKTPEHIAVHFMGRLTHCGDRHDIEASKEILALPVTAPWGTTMRAAAMAVELQPKIVIPIHDWHWRDEAREIQYNNLSNFFGEQGITFIKAVNGEAFEV